MRDNSAWIPTPSKFQPPVPHKRCGRRAGPIRVANRQHRTRGHVMACHDPPAVIDSFERFFGVLIEQIAGKWAVLAIPASSHDHSRDH